MNILTIGFRYEWNSIDKNKPAIKPIRENMLFKNPFLKPK